MSNTIVVSVGGSLIVPDNIDENFLTELKNVVNIFLNKGYKFLLISGGGRTARNYQDAAKKIGKIDNDSLDKVGIEATKLNAQLLKAVFADNIKQKDIIDDPSKDLTFVGDIMIASGWKPGHSTDNCAVMLAEKLGIEKMVNLTNVDYVYDSNPKENPKAKSFDNMKWNEFINLLPEKWDPGLSAPFDPIAARRARDVDMEVVIINGKNLERFEKYLNNEKFKGTIIKG